MRRVPVWPALIALLLAACGGPAEPAATEPGTQVTTTQAATTSVVTSPSTVAISQATTTTTPAELSIVGDDEFAEHTESALALLETEAPESYEQVLEYIEVIDAVSEGSGMDVFTKTFLVGESTAFAPGFSREEQAVWYASAIVHDSCHSRQYSENETYTGRDAELECLGDQLAALQDLGLSPYYEDYVSGLIEGVDDPDNDYWNDPNRHW